MYHKDMDSRFPDAIDMVSTVANLFDVGAHQQTLRALLLTLKSINGWRPRSEKANPRTITTAILCQAARHTRHHGSEMERVLLLEPLENHHLH